jgi:hypothetical protein
MECELETRVYLRKDFRRDRQSRDNAFGFDDHFGARLRAFQHGQQRGYIAMSDVLAQGALHNLGKFRQK